MAHDFGQNSHAVARLNKARMRAGNDDAVPPRFDLGRRAAGVMHLPDPAERVALPDRLAKRHLKFREAAVIAEVKAGIMRLLRLLFLLNFIFCFC